MANMPIELSFEQSLTLENFKRNVAKMSLEQSQEFTIKIFELMLMRETFYKKMRIDDFSMANVATSIENL